MPHHHHRRPGHRARAGDVRRPRRGGASTPRSAARTRRTSPGPRVPLGERHRPAARGRQAADRAARGVRRADHRRDGQAARRGAGRGRQVRLELRGRRRLRRRLAGRPRGRHRGAPRSWLSYEPLGVVFAVMPWNYPFWQVLRFACAALVAGNAGVLKHSPNVTGCALAIERLFADAGAPAGLFTTARAGRRAARRDDAADHRRPARRRGHPDRQRAGRRGRRRAPPGAFLKKSVLELGGSDPFVVLDDADLDGRRRRRREVALRQRRPELHRRQAVHRGRVGGRRVRARCRRAGRAARGRRPDRPAPPRADGARRPARPAARPGARRRSREGAVAGRRRRA